MNLSLLTAISPIDGRYASKVDALRPIASEFGLMRARVEVELAWIKSLSSHPQIDEVARFQNKQSRKSMRSLPILPRKTVTTSRRSNVPPTMM